MNDFTITAEAAEMRLDRFLRREIPGLTQGVLQILLRNGKIKLNGAKAEANARLAEGDLLRVPEIAPPVAMPKERHIVKMDPARIRELEGMIIYRDDAVIALNKPAGLAVQGGSGITVHVDGMLDHLREGEDGERPKLVHRLDRDTSGILLLARSSQAARQLSTLFRSRNVEKIYWALLTAVPEPPQGRVDLPLKRVEFGNVSRSEPSNRKDPEAQSAVTEYKVLDSAGRKFCLAELRPQTGRMHQLRAHALALGTPILGDAAYGGIFAEGFADQLHLHARRLVVPHPDGGTLVLEAALPKHMQDSMKYLGFTVPETGKSVRRT
jgi:23S rRNA pseudouridine955/2504/2580 synthase